MLSNAQSGALTSIGKGIAALALGESAPKLNPSPPSVASTAEQRAKWIGRYANPNVGSPIITERDGALLLRWCQSCDDVYLAAAGPASVYDRQDSIALELLADGSIRMSWPEGEPQTFARVNR